MNLKRENKMIKLLGWFVIGVILAKDRIDVTRQEQEKYDQEIKEML